MTHARHPSSVASGLEFRPGNGDDSWYFVSLWLQYGKLIVRHEGCSDKRGKELEVADVKNGKELYDKFRPPSRRLEDENCQEVNPGCKVCVSCYPDEQESPESIRYFDAEIEKISRLKHIIVSGEAQCMCTYDIVWLSGPKEGQRDTVHCENIYLLQSGSVQSHPVLKDFVKLLRHKKDCKAQSIVEKSMIKRYNLRNAGSRQADELIRMKNGYGWSIAPTSDCLKTLYFDGHEREDMKSEENFFPRSQILLLDNLEKDVTPSDVLGVIHQATSSWVKVYISPSRKFEPFTKGFVCFKDQASFQKAYEYLRSERISIVSSKGRPWVVFDAEDGLCEGSFGGLTTGTEVLHPSFGSLVSNKIRILHKGTPEYEQAELLKQNFLNWRRCLKKIHRRLGEEESEIERE